MLIEELPRQPSDLQLEGLSDVLLDAVASGASVSFMADLTRARALEWWRGTLARADRRAVFLAARDEHGIAGTVQLHPAWAPNQPHRADVAKLLVHRRARGRGLAGRLMRELEVRATTLGFTLLTLDTCQGSPAERLYGRLGWTAAGVIPRFALNPDGSWCDTVLFYKALTAGS